MRDKRAAMCSLQEISGRLLQSISCGDTGSLADVLDARAAGLPGAWQTALHATLFRPGPQPPCERGRSRRSRRPSPNMEGDSQLESLRVQTLAMQSECEEALRAALAVTAGRIHDTVDQRKVRSAYCSPSSPGPSRFLDKKK